MIVSDLVKPEKGDVVAKFMAPAFTLYLTSDKVVAIRRLGRNAGGPVAGAVAEVASAGNVASRATTTRGLLGGGKLGQKKIDARESYVTITGSGWSVSEKIDPMLNKKARKLVAAVNAAASAARTPAAAVAGDHEVLANLAKLHAAGVLTDEEFAAKKAQVLDRM